jgi:hypothetical protein
MSDALATSPPAPRRRKVSFWTLMFGCWAAPVFWIGQLTLGYWASAELCYGSDHPTVTEFSGTLHGALLVFDVVAIAAALMGGAVSLGAWQATREENKGDVHHALHVGEGRSRFMALWGIMSSLWFLGAIVFNTIGSLVVPLCTP